MPRQKGAGHSGLFIATRLKALGIKSVVVDRCSRIGDSWRNRYDSLVLHDTSYYAELPYIKYPADWPVRFFHIKGKLLSKAANS